MSIPKYIYVDDENDESVTSLINGFNDTGLVKVKQLSINKGMNFSELEGLIKSKIVDENYDGLLIDLRLDGEGPNQLEYSAISISAELRAICARKEINSFPIVLCSTLPKIKETYKSDKTSHDLFDYTFRKSENPDYERFSKKLKALAEGYITSVSYTHLDVYKRQVVNLLMTGWLKHPASIFQQQTRSPQQCNFPTTK